MTTSAASHFKAHFLFCLDSYSHFKDSVELNFFSYTFVPFELLTIVFINLHCISINSSTMEIWNENSIFMNSIQYIDYNLIDQISGVHEGNKYREATKLTNHVICGTSLKSEDFVIKWKTNGQTRHKIYIEVCF